LQGVVLVEGWVDLSAEQNELDLPRDERSTVGRNLFEKNIRSARCTKALSSAEIHVGLGYFVATKNLRRLNFESVGTKG
jgi:hypothetical protein